QAARVAERLPAQRIAPGDREDLRRRAALRLSRLEVRLLRPLHEHPFADRARAAEAGAGAPGDLRGPRAIWNDLGEARPRRTGAAARGPRVRGPGLDL